MAQSDEWISFFRRDLARLERQHRSHEELRPVVRRRRYEVGAEVDAVWLRHSYRTRPVVGVAAADLSALDLAFRRAAYASYHGLGVDIFRERSIRLPLRVGLQLRGARDGSLESLLDIPTWIVVALASQPVTALANLVTLLSQREAIRIKLRRFVLTEEEREMLQSAERPAPEPPPAELVSGPAEPVASPYRGEPEPSVPQGFEEEAPAQGTLPSELLEPLAGTEPLVDLDIGDVHIRGVRPDIDVVVQQGAEMTAVSIRQPRR